jgi:predicted restriction endonuclease
VLECNHLKPYGKRGSNDPRNGLVLCRTHHRAFELGSWSSSRTRARSKTDSRTCLCSVA